MLPLRARVDGRDGQNPAAVRQHEVPQPVLEHAEEAGAEEVSAGTVAGDVLGGDALWSAEAADLLPWLAGLPESSVDLVVGSPPYEDARTYGEVKFSRRGQQWVDWMVEVFRACLRVCKGVVCMVVEGRTNGYRWSATPALLMADLHRAGACLRKPPAFRRVGIPGSGGPDWWRNDYEFCVCATAKKGRLPWSDNTATGGPPKYGPGGRMSNRLKSGKRVYERNFKDLGDGGHLKQHYTIPDRANPGNVIACTVGGGKIGDREAHENEAPYPEKLAEPFVRCFCPPGGVACDPFGGSFTTAAVALRWGRRFVGCDLRPSQIEIGRRRLAKIEYGEALRPKPEKKTRRSPKPPAAAKTLFDDLEETA